MYFEGKITNLRIIRLGEQDNAKKNFSHKNLVLQETSFRGFFKGHLHRWNDAENVKELNL